MGNTKPRIFHLSEKLKELISKAKKESEAEKIIALLEKTGTEKKIIESALFCLIGEKTESCEEIEKIKEIEDKNIGSVENSVLAKVIMGISKDFKNIIIRMALLILEENYEKIDIYIPIAHKAGLNLFVAELEDLKFRLEKPQEYELVKAMIDIDRNKQEEILISAKKQIKSVCKKNCFVSGRTKHYYGIYKKINRGYKFKDIHDIYGLRIICDSKEEIYKIVNRISESFFIKEIEDYYKKPKKSGYKSVHLVADIDGKEFEIQVIEWDVHWENEMGKSAHWIYKNIEKDKSATIDEQLSITKQLIDVFNREKEKFKYSIFGNDVYAFTPQKDLIVLPSNSSILDFAFAVHTDIGLKAKQGKVNGNIKPLDYILKSGDIVEISLDKEVQINRNWLNLVSSQKAKQKIRSYLQIRKGRESKEKEKDKINIKKLKIAKCCSPSPKDEVVGYRTTKKKIIVHKIDCPNLKYLDNEKIVDIEFPNIGEFLLLLEISAKSSPSALPSILNVFKKNKAVIKHMNIKITKNSVIYRIESMIKNYSFFSYLVENLKKEKDVLNVKRI